MERNERRKQNRQGKANKTKWSLQYLIIEGSTRTILQPYQTTQQSSTSLVANLGFHVQATSYKHFALKTKKLSALHISLVSIHVDGCGALSALNVEDLVIFKWFSKS